MTARASEDWRLASAEVVGGLLEAERQRWMAALHWDAQPAFDLLERSRQSGQAAGLLARDADGRPHGFTHYFLHNRRLQIGGLVAESGEVTRQLLDDVLRTPEAELAGEVLCFAFPASTALEGALTQRRFDVTRYSYLQRALAPATAAAPSTAPAAIASHLRPWTEEDAVDTVRLFARPYAGAGGGQGLRAARHARGMGPVRRPDRSRRRAAAASCRRPASRCSTRLTIGCAAWC